MSTTVMQKSQMFTKFVNKQYLTKMQLCSKWESHNHLSSTFWRGREETTFSYYAGHGGNWEFKVYRDQSFDVVLKVSKSRKQILKFSFAPKNERKYFFISALAYKKRSNQKSSVRVKIKSSN